MRPFNIIQVTDTLDAGGAERVATLLTKELEKRGYNSSLCATRRLGPLVQDLKEYQVFCLDRKSTFDFRGVLKFRKLVKQLQIDVVHAHGIGSALFSIIALAGFKKTKIIHHDHNPNIANRQLYKEWIFLKRVNGWIAVSKPIFDWVQDRINYSKVKMIPNGIEVNKFGTGNKKKHHYPMNFLVLANYSSQKNHWLLIEASKLLLKTNINFNVHCYGKVLDAIYYKNIIEKLHHENLNHCLQFNEAISDVFSVLENSHFGLLSSGREGLPIALLEYMASKLPVIVTDVGQCGKIVTESNCGIVVPKGDAHALAEAMEYFMGNPELLDKLGENGRKYVREHHNVDVFVNQVIDFYKNLDNYT